MAEVQTPWAEIREAHGATIHYLGGYERNVGNGQDTTETITKYYRALGRLVAFRRNGSLYWVGTDHLGGTVAVASSSFGPIATMRYTPYGVSRDNTDDPLTDSLFTGQKLDASIGLYWYGSRAYDQSLGRFVAPDTVVPDPSDARSLNRYAYGYDSPVNHVDPTGHFAWALPVALAVAGGVAGGIAAGLTSYRRGDNAEDVTKAVALGALGGAVTGAATGAAVLLAPEIGVAGAAAALANSASTIAGVSTFLASVTTPGDPLTVTLDAAAAGIAAAVAARYAPIFAGLESTGAAVAASRITANMERIAAESGIEASLGGTVGPWVKDEVMGFAKIAGDTVSQGIREITKPRSDVGPSSSTEVTFTGLGQPDVAIPPGGEWSGSIPAGVAPGGVGVVNITASNPSGQPEDGRGWDAQNREAREAAWIRGGAPDYNTLRAEGVPGYC